MIRHYRKTTTHFHKMSTKILMFTGISLKLQNWMSIWNDVRSDNWETRSVSIGRNACDVATPQNMNNHRTTSFKEDML